MHGICLAEQVQGGFNGVHLPHVQDFQLRIQVSGKQDKYKKNQKDKASHMACSNHNQIYKICKCIKKFM